jgi:enoyl-CoA hydratase
MELETVQYDLRDHVATITLNRPKVLNAMNRQLWHDLESALNEARTDADVKVIVITGQGRAFSTGADLKESKTRSTDAYREYLKNLQEVSRKILRFDKPIIAAINGYALGSGYELALACDIRLAAKDAQIGSPEARVASSVTGGALRLLQDLVGPGKAKEMLFTAEPIDGSEAQRIGLVNKAVDADELLEETYRLADQIARNSPFSLQMIKRGLRLAKGEVSMEALMEFEIEACLACVATKDRNEALHTFENRKQGVNG